MTRRAPASIPAAAMLTHFTRASTNATALDNLVAILKDNVIRGSSRMVRGGHPAVCMFDVPILTGPVEEQAITHGSMDGSMDVDGPTRATLRMIHLPWAAHELSFSGEFIPKHRLINRPLKTFGRTT